VAVSCCMRCAYAMPAARAAARPESSSSERGADAHACRPAEALRLPGAGPASVRTARLPGVALRRVREQAAAVGVPLRPLMRAACTRAALGDGDVPSTPPAQAQTGDWDDWGDWGGDEEWGAHLGPALPGRQLSDAEARRRRLARWARALPGALRAAGCHALLLATRRPCAAAQARAAAQGAARRVPPADGGRHGDQVPAGPGHRRHRGAHSRGV